MRKQRNSGAEWINTPPSEAELKQLWSSQLDGIHYHCDDSVSHAEMGQDIILTLNLPYKAMTLPSENDPEDEGMTILPDGEKSITIVFAGRHARDLRRSMIRTFEQLSEQKRILKRQERQEMLVLKNTRKFWNQQVVPLLRKSEKGAA